MGDPHQPSTPSWILREPDADRWRPIARSHGIHPLAAQILVRRGVESPDDAARFLEPMLSEHMPNPQHLADLDAAVDRILRARRDGESIAIHGDYDVDGLTGTALLVETLRSLGADPNYVIPHRIRDGYGLSNARIDELADQGADLLIAVDCGVTATEQIKRARNHGLDVIVIDHHKIDGNLPDAHAVLNPRREDCNYTCDVLSAVGVAFNLAVGLRAAVRDNDWLSNKNTPDIKAMLDLVALGTVGDVVPLRSANRLFVKRGLELIRRRHRPGIAAIMANASRDEQLVDAETIGYRIAPRLNAAGRLSDAAACVELLTTRDPTRAQTIADELESLNNRRRQIQDEILEIAERRAAEQVQAGHQIVVLAEEGWHRGVLGVVAGKLSDEWNRPVVALSIDDGTAHGSARSVPGIDITALLADTRDHLESFGGHDQAAGLTMPSDSIETFRGDLRAAADAAVNQLPEPTLEIDGTVQLSELTPDFGRDLSKLGPFGSGLREPLFLAENLEATQSRTVGDNNDHLQATFADETGQTRAIGFSMADKHEILSGPVDVAFTPKFDIFRGRERVEMHMRALRPANES